MTPVGLGIDIVSISRVASIIARRGLAKFAGRILNENELKDFASKDFSHARAIEYLAGRYV